MSNVIRTLVGSGSDKEIVQLVTVIGADETNLVVYDNSAFVNNVNKGNLMGYMISGSDCLVNLAWDQTTDSPAVSVNPINSPKADMSKFGGIHNPHGTGATGDLLLTTTGIAAGEQITLILWIVQS